jgi:hypothetical protein
MKRFALFLLGSAVVLGLMAFSSIVTWRLTKTNEMFRGALVQTALDLHALDLLESGRADEAIDFLNREVDANVILAAGVPSESWLPPKTARFAECVLKRIKRHRQEYPFTHPDAEFARMVQQALAPNLESVPPNKALQLPALSASQSIHPGPTMACVNRPLAALKPAGS